MDALLCAVEILYMGSCYPELLAWLVALTHLRKVFPNPLTDHLFFSSRNRARADTSSQEQALCWHCCSISGNRRPQGTQCTFLRNEEFPRNIYGSASMPCSFHHISKDLQQECLGKPEMTQISEWKSSNRWQNEPRSHRSQNKSHKDANWVIHLGFKPRTDLRITQHCGHISDRPVGVTLNYTEKRTTLLSSKLARQHLSSGS